MVGSEMEWVDSVGATAQGQMVTEARSKETCGEEQWQGHGLGVRGPKGYSKRLGGGAAPTGSFKLAVTVGPSTLAWAPEGLRTDCSSLCDFCLPCTHSSLSQDQPVVSLTSTVPHSQLRSLGELGPLLAQTQDQAWPSSVTHPSVTVTCAVVSTWPMVGQGNWALGKRDKTARDTPVGTRVHGGENRMRPVFESAACTHVRLLVLTLYWSSVRCHLWGKLGEEARRL